MTRETTPAQDLSVIKVRKAFADLTSGTAFDIGAPLPNGTLVVGIDTIVLTPFDSASSDLLDIGFAAHGAVVADPDAYRNDTSLAAAAGTKVSSTVLPGLINSTDGAVQLTGTWTQTGGSTSEGEVLILVYCAYDGKDQYDL